MKNILSPSPINAVLRATAPAAELRVGGAVLLRGGTLGVLERASYTGRLWVIVQRPGAPIVVLHRDDVVAVAPDDVELVDGQLALRGAALAWSEASRW